MKDHKMKLLPASLYDVAAIETWLSDQARQGWLPERIGTQAAKMERGEPVDCQYRLEPIDGAELIQDPALRDYYMEAGWEFVCFTEGGWFFGPGKQGKNSAFRVWRSTRPDPVEIHCDPEVEAGAYRRLTRRLYWGCAVSVCFVLWWLFLIWPRPSGLAGWREREVFTAPGTGGLLATLLYLYFLAWMVSGARAVCRLRKRLKQGIPMDHTRRCGHGWKRFHTVGLVLAALLLLLSICWRPSWQPLQSDTPPLLLASELGKEGEPGEGALWKGGNLWASRVMQGIEREKDTVILKTRYASLRLSFLAEPLLGEMTDWWDPADRVTLADSRFDQAYYMRGTEWQHLALRRGGQVLYVAAKVPEDLREHIDGYDAALTAAK